jgi:hypothetical protein
MGNISVTASKFGIEPHDAIAINPPDSLENSKQVALTGPMAKKVGIKASP